MTRLIGLYPRAWRTRYEDEFLALLSDRPPDVLDRLDIVRGAIDARLHPPAEPSPAPIEPPVGRGPWPVRAGWLTIAGGILWISALVVAINGPMIVEEWGSYRDGAAALPLFFLAIVLLGVGMIALVLDLPASAHAARSAAFLSSMTGLLWGLAPWLIWAGMIAFAGLLVVGVAARRAGRWSWLELLILVAGIVPGWIIGFAGLSGLLAMPTPNPDLQFFLFGLLLPSWLIVGASLVRAPRRAVASSPPGA
jgi:hypothetical protein